ncbi:zinc-finger associated domain (zf-AD) domain-containing protein [Phthorimaea operculella]|nr:zinc-finger associated domain (zf-AD) domain-containing protein [Phthorimaea operculella]
MKTNIECRVCLKDGGKIPIFGDSNKPDISLEVSTYGSIEVSRDDEFPKALCKGCFKLLEHAISFRKSALQADLVLKQRQAQKCLTPCVMVKIEPNDENAANIPKPEFLSVNSTENDTKVKNEYLSQDISLDDDRSYFDAEESTKSVLDYNKTEMKFTNYEDPDLMTTMGPPDSAPDRQKKIFPNWSKRL